MSRHNSTFLAFAVVDKHEILLIIDGNEILTAISADPTNRWMGKMRKAESFPVIAARFLTSDEIVQRYGELFVRNTETETTQAYIHEVPPIYLAISTVFA